MQEIFSDKYVESANIFQKNKKVVAKLFFMLYTIFVLVIMRA